MLIPKRVKRRKQHKGRMTGAAHKGNTVAYGEYGLVAEECGWIKSNQIEAARIAMTRFIKRGGKVWIDIFPHKPITKHPAEARMGSGKGSDAAGREQAARQVQVCQKRSGSRGCGAG